MGSWVFINNPTGYLEMPPREYNPLKGVIIPESAVTRTHTRGTEGSDTQVHMTASLLQHASHRAALLRMSVANNDAKHHLPQAEYCEAIP